MKIEFDYKDRIDCPSAEHGDVEVGLHSFYLPIEYMRLAEAIYYTDEAGKRTCLKNRNHEALVACLSNSCVAEEFTRAVQVVHQANEQLLTNIPTLLSDERPAPNP